MTPIITFTDHLNTTINKIIDINDNIITLNKIQKNTDFI